MARSWLTRLWARARSLARGILRRSEVERDMREEFRHHIEMRTEDLVREGIPRHQASRRAHLEFGHVEAHRESARRARGLRWLDQMRFSWIDVRLGLRMLVKHPGMTLVAAFALAVGIPVGMAPSHLADAIERPLPEDPENRVRAIRFWDPVISNAASPVRADYELWRAELTSVSAVGGFRTLSVQIDDEGRAEAVKAATVTASAFEILGRPPLLGRALVAADEAAGAAAVAVIGHDLWRARFGSDPNVLGRTIRIAGRPHTLVGVMPEGFHFPMNQDLWLPDREDFLTGREDTPLGVFLRLADGVSIDVAQAELSAVGRADLSGSTELRERLRPEIVPFGMFTTGIPRAGLESVPGFLFFRILALVLLLVAAGNVAMLIFARTAIRFRELAVRTALGASRTRIVAQIFAETLVLAVLASGAGVLVIDRVLGNVDLSRLVGETDIPYWFDLGLTPKAALHALGLAVLAATVAGVVPALRLTGRNVQGSLKQATGSSLRFGRVTAALIVADVALSVAVISIAFALSSRMNDTLGTEQLAGIPTDEYLAVELRMPVTAATARGGDDGALFAERLAATQRTVVERLLAEPGVRSVAVADALPGMDHRSRPVEVEGVEGRSDGTWVRTARVDVDFFEALDAPVLGGRDFDAADLDDEGSVAIVNTVFVERLLGGGDPLGRRVRIVNRGGGAELPWLDVVGVVGHLGTNMVNPEGGPALYLPAAPGSVHPMWMGVHVAAPPAEVAPRLRTLVAELAPDAVVGAPVELSRVRQGDWYLTMAIAGGLGLLVVVLVTLAASGIHAIVSFSVSERTREIGIRGALGAPRSDLVLSILRRSLMQIGLGALLGAPLAAWILSDLPSGSGPEATFGTVLLTAGLAMGVVAAVGFFSCLAPTRRILGIDASEALRAEG